MIRSMTGFGRAENTLGNKNYLVEIKSLNGKQLELSLRMPPLLKPYEFDIRNILQEHLIRGTIECNVTIKQNGSAKPVSINTDLIRAYYGQLNELAQELNMDTNAVLSSLLRLPEIVSPTTDVLDEKDFDEFKKVLLEAISTLNNFRIDEGKVLEADLRQRLKNIDAKRAKVLALAPQREDNIRTEITQLLEKHVGAEKYDENRLEQELIYYMEKIDLHEEQVRLHQHCEYFEEVMNSSDAGVGKKIGFILQEVGREINTTGSKAYDAQIQKLVVEMKDELEKAKEQVLNVL